MVKEFIIIISKSRIETFYCSLHLIACCFHFRRQDLCFWLSSLSPRIIKIFLDICAEHSQRQFCWTFSKILSFRYFLENVFMKYLPKTLAQRSSRYFLKDTCSTFFQIILPEHSFICAWLVIDISPQNIQNLALPAMPCALLLFAVWIKHFSSNWFRPCLFTNYTSGAPQHSSSLLTPLVTSVTIIIHYHLLWITMMKIELILL